MMAGWAYLMAGIMTVDSLLLGLLLMNVKWPKRWKMNRLKFRNSNPLRR